MATDYLLRVCVDLTKSICVVFAAMFANVHCLYCVCVNFAKNKPIFASGSNNGPVLGFACNPWSAGIYIWGLTVRCYKGGGAGP